MTMDWFAPFLKRFTNLEELLLKDVMTLTDPKTVSLDHPELPCLKGELHIGRSVGEWDYFEVFISQLALFPSALHAITFYGNGGVSTEVNELLAACRGTLTRLEFQDCEFPALHPVSAG